MNEIVKGLGNGDGETKMRPRRNVMKSWMNTAQAQVPKGHEPWRGNAMRRGQQMQIDGQG